MFFIRFLDKQFLVCAEWCRYSCWINLWSEKVFCIYIRKYFSKTPISNEPNYSESLFCLLFDLNYPFMIHLVLKKSLVNLPCVISISVFQPFTFEVTLLYHYNKVWSTRFMVNKRNKLTGKWLRYYHSIYDWDVSLWAFQALNLYLYCNDKLYESRRLLLTTKLAALLLLMEDVCKDWRWRQRRWKRTFLEVSQYCSELQFH